MSAFGNNTIKIIPLSFMLEDPVLASLIKPIDILCNKIVDQILCVYHSAVNHFCTFSTY